MPHPVYTSLYRATVFCTGKPTAETGRYGIAHFSSWGLSRRRHKRAVLKFAARLKAPRITFKGLPSSIIHPPA